MPETSRQFRRQPEESMVLDDFSMGMDIRGNTKTPHRIIANMYPCMDGGLEGIRGDNAYIAGTSIQWTGGTASSWLQDLHNENVAVFREGESKFFIVKPSTTTPITVNQTSTYGTTAIATPLYASKKLSTTINGWTVHAKPWTGWYEGIRTGIKGPLNYASNWSWEPPQYFSITETGHYTSTSDIKTQQLGLPTPIGTGLHLVTDHGVPFGSSKVMRQDNDAGSETGGTWNKSYLETPNHWCMCVDNNYPTSKHAPVVHKFQYCDMAGVYDSINHSIYTQSGGDLLYSKDYPMTELASGDDSGTDIKATGKPMACSADKSGNIWLSYIHVADGLKLVKFAPPGAAGSDYTMTIHGWAENATGSGNTLGVPGAVQMGYDEFDDRVYTFVTCKNSTRGGTDSGTHGTVVMVISVDFDEAVTDAIVIGYIRLPADGSSIQQFTADFICDGFEDDATTGTHRRCIFTCLRGEDVHNLADLYWGYFDTGKNYSEDYTNLITDMNTTTANGGKVTGLNVSRKYALQMGARSRDGDTCDVVVSFISEKGGMITGGGDYDKTVHRVYASRECNVKNPDFSMNGVFKTNEVSAGEFGVDKDDKHTTLTSAIVKWVSVSMPLLKWDKYGSAFGSTGAHDHQSLLGDGAYTSFPAHRGDCLNRLSRTGDLYLRWEIIDSDTNPLVYTHFDMDTANFINYDSAEEPISAKERNALEDTGLMPGETGSGPLKPTGYPDIHSDRTVGTGFTPHFNVKQGHTPLQYNKFTDHNTLQTEHPQVFYPMTFNNNPFLCYNFFHMSSSDTDVVTANETGRIEVMCHPPVHGGSAHYPMATVDSATDYNLLPVNAGGNWIRNNKLYSGANFHPMTPFIKDAGEGDVGRYKTFNKKDPICAGQDINVVSRVKTIDGKMMPGIYRYKFSFAKAGAEEKEYRSTGGEGAIYWDDDTEAFFEVDTSQSSVTKGLRFYFNMGLLKDKDAILFKNDGAITNGASTYLRVKPVFAGTASYATHSGGATVIWDRTNAPVPYDWWIAHDIFTGPYTTTSVSGLRAGSEGFTAAYIDPSNAGNLTTPANFKLGYTFDKTTINDGTSIYRHGQKNLSATTTAVADKAPYIKKLLIWRTADISQATTDKSKYYKVGEFDLADADDSRSWEGYYFDDTYESLELSSKTGDHKNQPPLSENVSAIATSGGKLFVAHTPSTGGESSGLMPSSIQYSSEHFEYFPRTQTITLDDTAAIHHMKDFQGNLFVFTDEGVYALTGTNDMNTMTSSKVSQMVIHNHANDGERTLEIDGRFWCLGDDGLYVLMESGMVNISVPMKEWFEKKRKIPLGIYYDKYTYSIVIYQKEQSGTIAEEITIKKNTSARYMEAVCYYLPTQAWWCKTNATARLYTDIINPGMNKESGTVQRYLPLPVTIGVRKDLNSNTTDNIVHIGKGYGDCKTDDTTGASGSVEYIYETSVMGDARLERYWDKVDVEILPNNVSIQTTHTDINLNLDSFNANEAVVSYGSEKSLTYKSLVTINDLVAHPLIETADVNAKNEYARLRLNMTWHDSSDGSSETPPRLTGVRFRTRITGMDRTNP